MNKSNYATSIAVLIAGAMISAAIYLRPTQVPDAERDSSAAAARNEPKGEGRGIDDVIRAMEGDRVVPLDSDGWEAPADGASSKDDLRRILDAWEKHWFKSNEHLKPNRDHGGII